MGAYHRGEDNREVADKNFEEIREARLANVQLSSRTVSRLGRRQRLFVFTLSDMIIPPRRMARLLYGELQKLREYHFRIMKRSTSCRVRYPFIPFVPCPSQPYPHCNRGSFANDDKKDEHLVEKLGIKERAIFLLRTVFILGTCEYSTQFYST